MAYKVVLTEGKVPLGGITTKLYFLAKKYDGLVLPKSCTLAEKSSTMYAYEKVVPKEVYVQLNNNSNIQKELYTMNYTMSNIFTVLYDKLYNTGNIILSVFCDFYNTSSILSVLYCTLYNPRNILWGVYGGEYIPW